MTPQLKKAFPISSDSSPPFQVTVQRIFSAAPDTDPTRPSSLLLGGPPFPPPRKCLSREEVLMMTATSIMSIQLISYIIYSALGKVNRFFEPFPHRTLHRGAVPVIIC